MGHPDVLGKVLPGYYADVILVDGDPLQDISLFQDTKNLHAIVVNGHIHKNGELPAWIPRTSDYLPVRVVPKGESVIPLKGKAKKAVNGHEANGESNGHANGNPDDEGAESNGVNWVGKKGKKQAGFFEYGVAEDDWPMSGEENNGGKTGVSAEVVKSL